MKKIINGKRYDTKTAELMGKRNDSSDSRFLEALYRKKTGEFFLYGKGGPNSKYGWWHGNTRGPGEEIIPLTVEKAREWAKEYLCNGGYESIFVVAEEGETEKAHIGAWIDHGLKNRIDILRETQGHTIKDVVKAGVEALEAGK